MEKLSKILNALITLLSLRFLVAFIKARGFTKEKDLHLISQACDFATFSLGVLDEEDAFETVIIDGVKISVIFNPYIHLFKGFLGSIATCHTIGRKNYVIVDATYQRLSRKAQIAILCHELGHIVHDHNRMIARSEINYMLDREKAMKDGQVYWMETEADDFACLVMDPSDWCDGMLELSHHISNDSKEELLLRIQHVRMSGPEPYSYEPYDEVKIETRKLY